MGHCDWPLNLTTIRDKSWHVYFTMILTRFYLQKRGWRTGRTGNILILEKKNTKSQCLFPLPRLRWATTMFSCKRMEALGHTRNARRTSLGGSETGRRSCSARLQAHCDQFSSAMGHSVQCALWHMVERGQQWDLKNLHGGIRSTFLKKIF